MKLAIIRGKTILSSAEVYELNFQANKNPAILLQPDWLVRELMLYD